MLSVGSTANKNVPQRKQAKSFILFYLFDVLLQERKLGSTWSAPVTFPGSGFLGQELICLFAGWWMIVAHDEILCFKLVTTEVKSPNCSFIPSVLKRERKKTLRGTVLLSSWRSLPLAMEDMEEQLSLHPLPCPDKAWWPHTVDYSYCFHLWFHEAGTHTSSLL